MPSLLRAQTILVGDSTVGKSAISQMFHSDGSHFPKSYSMTPGVDVAMKSLSLAEGGGGVEFCILDCSGKDVFSPMVEKMWDQPSLLMVVYDVTNRDSFEHCSSWSTKVKKHFGGDASMPALLVGNKKDLTQRRVVKEDEGEEMAKKLGMSFCECSAKDWQSVVEAFRILANTYHQHFEEKMETITGLC